MVMSVEEKRKSWQEDILQWRASGQSAATWCKENNYPYKLFLWRKSQYEHKISVPQKTLEASSFIELTDHNFDTSHIELHVKGVSVYLREGFDPELLKSTLQILRSL